MSLDDRTRIHARYLLALALMIYAVSKVIPTQFGYLPPGELLRPLGQLSRFDVLWTFMSVSPGYTAWILSPSVRSCERWSRQSFTIGSGVSGCFRNRSTVSSTRRQ